MNPNKPYTKAITLGVVLVFMFTWCTSFRLINHQRDALHTELELGDVVKVVTKDGRHLQFQIIEIRADSIFSDSQRIGFDEILKIEKKKVDAAKTTGAILLGSLGIVAVAALIFSIILADAISDIGD